LFSAVPVKRGSGVVHGDIETPKPRDGLVDHIADAILLANVGVDELGFRAESAQLLNERLAGLITPTGNDHLRALLGKGDGGGAADTCEASRDQSDWLVHCLPLMKD
jgi:hypothetical protein